MSNRLLKLRDSLAAKAVDAILITQSDNRRYLSGFHGTAGYLLITQKHAVLATDSRYTEQAKDEAPRFQIEKITGGLDKWLPALVGDIGINSLGFEGEDISFEFHRRLKAALKKTRKPVSLVSLTDLVESIRSVKEPQEISLLTEAARLTDAAFEEVAPLIRAGMTEKQVAWTLEKALRERGSEPLPFDIIVASGPNAALPHARPTERKIKEGEPIMIDMGAKYRGYASDLSRTVFVGKAGDKLKEVYNTVLAAQQAALNGVAVGMTGSKADAIARALIKKAGYAEAFGHSLGHGVGLAEHELPRLGPGSKDKLENGMVFTVEPGIYLPGWGGVRIEDTVVLEGGKLKTLTKAGKMAC